MTLSFRAAAAQYPVDFLDSWPAYEAKVGRWVAEAASAGARLLVFPEYASLELASLLPEAERQSLQGQLAGLQRFLPAYLDLHAALARRHGVYALAGSYPVRVSDRSWRNRAYLVGPSGKAVFQEKIQMTRFERERWGVAGGDEFRAFETDLGCLGVCLCYDAEFPPIARALAEAGAEVLLVPSCTDTVTGANRIRIACRARALENQCHVISAPTVGEAPWSEAIDRNVGVAAIFGPPDNGFPDDGILAAGAWNRPGWVYAEVDLEAAREVRRDGEVLLHRDWLEESGRVREVERIAV